MLRLRREQTGQNKMRTCKGITFLSLFTHYPQIVLADDSGRQARAHISSVNNSYHISGALVGAEGWVGEYSQSRYWTKDTKQFQPKWTFLSWPCKVSGLGKLFSTKPCFLALSLRQSTTKCTLLWDI